MPYLTDLTLRLCKIYIHKGHKSINVAQTLHLEVVEKVHVCRSNHWRCFVKKGVLRNFAKFTKKHLCHTPVPSGLRPASFLKKESLAQLFSCEFCEIYKNTFFTEHLRTTTSVYDIISLLPKLLFFNCILLSSYLNSAVY